jgi:hypothetical protein
METLRVRREREARATSVRSLWTGYPSLVTSVEAEYLCGSLERKLK